MTSSTAITGPAGVTGRSVPPAKRRRHVIVTRTLILAMAVGMLATACGGGGGAGKTGGSAGGPKPPPPINTTSPPPLPTGYQPLDGGALTVAHPGGWATVQSPKGWSITAEYQRKAVPIARVGVITDVPQSATPDVVATTLFAGLNLASKIEQRQPNRPISVPGSRGALRVDYTYVDRATGNLGRGADISVVYGDRKAAAVRITGLRSTLSLEIIDRIVRTIAVKPAAQGRPA